MTIWRTSSYEGTGSVNAATEGGTTIQVNGGSASYVASTFRGTSCGEYTGQVNLTTTLAFPNKVYWRGWVRPTAAADANRLIVDFMNASVTQASISVDTLQKWRLRNDTGATVATSASSFAVNTWYGLEWWADRSLGQQQLKIYDSSVTLIETLTGACGLLAFTSHREGILQGAATWSLDYDDTALADTVINVTVGVPPTRTGQPKVWSGSAWVVKPAKVWDGTTWVAHDMQAWNGSSWTKSK